MVTHKKRKMQLAVVDLSSFFVANCCVFVPKILIFSDVKLFYAVIRTTREMKLSITRF